MRGASSRYSSFGGGTDCSSCWSCAHLSFCNFGMGCCQRWTLEAATTPESASGSEIDEPVFIKKNVRLGPFQTQILECRTKPLLGESIHVMVMPLKAVESQPGGVTFAPRIACVAHIHKTYNEQ